MGMEYSKTSNPINFSVAQGCLQLALSIAPSEAQGYNELGILAHHQGQHMMAVKLFARARELAPNEDTYVQNVGHAYLKCHE